MTRRAALPRIVRRAPAPLVALLCIALVQGLAWAVLVPAFHGPDEGEHSAYVQRMVEQRRIPWTTVTGERGTIAILPTDAERALEASGLGATAANPSMRPYGSEVDERRWDRVAADLDREDRADGGFTTGMRNPPLYPLYEAVPYLAASGGDIFDRQFAMRLATIPFLLAVVLFTWLLAGEVFGRRRVLQGTAAGVVALHPLLGMLGGLVNPDAALAALWAAGLYLCAVVVRRGPGRALVLALLAVVVAAALTHGRALPLVVPALAAVAIGAYRRAGPHGRRTRRVATAGAAAAATAAGLAGVWIALGGEVSAGRTRQFAAYLWQFYLPRPGFMEPTRFADWDVRDVYVDRFNSGFLKLDVELAPGLLDVLAVVSLAAFAAVLVALVVRRDAVRARAPLFAVLALAVVAMVGFLHVVAWREYATATNPILTGRYLLPLLPVAGLGLASIAAALPRRAAPAFAVLALGGVSLVMLAAFGATVLRFHA